MVDVGTKGGNPPIQGERVGLVAKVSRVIASMALSLVIAVGSAGCGILSSPEESLNSRWLKWQPIQPAEKMEDHKWLLGAWHCAKREFLPNSLLGPPNDYVYMEIAGTKYWESDDDATSLLFHTTLAMPDSKGRLGKHFTDGPLGYFEGFYTIGNPFMCDHFLMRRNPRNPTNEFILKHESSKDYLLFERVPPNSWNELLERWESASEPAR